jgi:hypothetical protein
VTLDPTPPLPFGARRSVSAITLFLDSLQVRWSRYVINFGFGDQQQLLTALRRPGHWFDAVVRAATFDKSLPGSTGTAGDWMKSLVSLLAVVLGLLVVKKYFDARFVAALNPGHQATARYQSFLTLIGKNMGLRKGSAETPDEFVQKATAAGVPCAEELTKLYQRARFSGNQASTELNRMDEILEQLKRT